MPLYSAVCVVLESGNPGGFPATYSGTVSDFSNADSVIFRPPLIADKHPRRQQQQQQEQHPAVNDYRLLRTEQDSRWLNGNYLAICTRSRLTNGRLVGAAVISVRTAQDCNLFYLKWSSYTRCTTQTITVMKGKQQTAKNNREITITPCNI